MSAEEKILAHLEHHGKLLELIAQHAGAWGNVQRSRDELNDKLTEICLREARETITKNELMFTHGLMPGVDY